MLKSHTLLLPIFISLLIHALVIGGGEFFGGSLGESAGVDTPAVEYDVIPEGSDGERDLRSNVEDSPLSLSDDRISLETADPKYRPYFARLQKKIAAKWEEPQRPSGASEGASLWVEITLEKKGTLKSVHVVESSKIKDYDFAAVRAIKKAAPFSEFPKEISAKELRIRASFVYE